MDYHLREIAKKDEKLFLLNMLLMESVSWLYASENLLPRRDTGKKQTGGGPSRQLEESPIHGPVILQRTATKELRERTRALVYVMTSKQTQYWLQLVPLFKDIDATLHKFDLHLLTVLDLPSLDLPSHH